MQIIADLHIHSKYSRATSRELNLENLSKWAKIKGVNLLSTADFTHPVWLAELKSKLVEASPGVFVLRENKGLEGNIKGNEGVYFILGTEISSIYSQGGKTRRIHNLIFAPSFEIVEKINKELLAWGYNLSSDGRPIIGLSSIELCKILFNISEDIFVVPAHIWTSWFSLYGANSGFDSINECFGEYASKIKAIETGLSSDPAMNWRIEELDSRAIISGSDAHSAQKIGREAVVIDIPELNYQNVIKAISSRNPGNLLYTIEFFPEEGKYHYTGHRNCQIVFSPKETKEKGTGCPVCGKKLTIGVMHRVEELAKRSQGFVPKDSPSYKSLVPLTEIIAEVLGQGEATAKVSKPYFDFDLRFQNEFNILISEPIKNLATLDEKVALGIEKMRAGEIEVSPGYDGLFGKVSVFKNLPFLPVTKQKGLFE